MTRNKTVILGGGVAAYSAAISLAAQGIKAVILNRQNSRRKPNPVGEHLPPEGKILLETLGLGQVLTSSHHRDSTGVVSHWSSHIGIERNYLFNPAGQGLNLDRQKFNETLLQASRAAGIDIINFERLNTISSHALGHSIEVVIGGKAIKYHADFLIDATGRSAIVARNFGAEIFRQDKLVGLYSYFKDTPCLDSRLTIEALEDGWWYTAPLQNNHIVAVYMTDSDLMPRGASARRQFWLDRLAASSAAFKRLGDKKEPENFQIVDAATQSLSQGCGKNWVAIGDAAMAFDPISAAGMTKALSSGINAADIVISHHRGLAFNVQNYQQDVDRKFQDYKVSARTAYAHVTHFPESKFWSRRQVN